MNKKGFTLVELLTALSLFLAVSAVFAATLKAAAKGVSSAEKVNTAVYALRSKMEEIKAIPFSQLIALQGSSFAGGKGRVVISPLQSDLVAIQLELQGPPDIKMDTLRGNY